MVRRQVDELPGGEVDVLKIFTNSSHTCIIRLNISDFHRIKHNKNMSFTLEMLNPLLNPWKFHVHTKIIF